MQKEQWRMGDEERERRDARDEVEFERDRAGAVDCG